MQTELTGNGGFIFSSLTDVLWLIRNVAASSKMMNVFLIRKYGTKNQLNINGNEFALLTAAGRD